VNRRGFIRRMGYLLMGVWIGGRSEAVAAEEVQTIGPAVASDMIMLVAGDEAIVMVQGIPLEPGKTYFLEAIGDGKFKVARESTLLKSGETVELFK
jgi:hypothetical protein